MPRKHHYKSASKEPPELDITTFLNLMVVLVPFLLITAVFSRITIVELNVPSGAGGPTNKPKVTIEVIIRKKGVEVGNGRSVVASMPAKNGNYDLKTLSRTLHSIKKNYPDKTDATILMEDDIDYATMIKIMDVVRVIELPNPDVVGADGKPEIQKSELFPDMSIGEAP